MKTIELIENLKKYPVFNIKKVKEIINKNDKYTKLVIHRMKKEKLITKIEKNKYTCQKDILVVASNIIWPSYISCWSALRYHNLTEQLPENIFIVTTKAKKKNIITINSNKIIFIKVIPRYFFGYNKEIYNNFEIFVADKEKAIIDSVLLKKVSFSEICGIIKSNKEEINFNILIEYLIKIKNKAIIKRFGFLLYYIGIDTKKLEELIDSKYIVLDYSLKLKGKKNKKWKVIENVEL